MTSAVLISCRVFRTEIPTFDTDSLAMHNLPRVTLPSRIASGRAGTLVPALAVALVAVLGGAALVLDRLWVDTAHIELRTAAESAALAAARELASDDLLRKDPSPQSRLMKARFAAARIAAQNFVTGDPLQLNIEADGDVRFGKLIADHLGTTELKETADNPTTVVVHARRSSDRDTEVSLPIQSLLGPEGANVVATSEATIDNRVVGLRSLDGLPIPTLPLAILASRLDNNGNSKPAKVKGPRTPKEKPTTPTWQQDIDQRHGSDRFGIDSHSGEIIHEPDGIPEITLRTPASGKTAMTTNAFVVAITGDWAIDTLRRQIREGWSATDLESHDGEIIPTNNAKHLAGLRGVDASTLGSALRDVVGQSRVCLLYDHVEDEPRSSAVTLRICGMIAGRVMSVRELSADECELVFQPAVLASRSAVLAADCPTHGTDSPMKSLEGSSTNKYLYKLQLTN